MSKKTLAYPEREQALVLAAVKSPETYDAAVSVGLLAEHIHAAPAAAIWAGLVALRERNEPVRSATLLEHLRRVGMEDAARPLLEQVRKAQVPSEAMAMADAGKVIAAAMARNAHRSVSAALSELATADDPQAALAVFRDRAFGVALEQDKSRRRRTTPEALSAVFYKIMDKAARHRRIVGVATFIDPIDQKTGGFRPGKVAIVAARPGAGKTAFLTSTLCEQVDRHDPVRAPMPPCLFFSLEMDDDELVSRVLCASAGIDFDAMMYGDMPVQSQLQAITAAADRIHVAPLDIDDTPRTVEQIAAEIYRWHRRRWPRGAPPGAHGSVFIDYLTRIKRSPGIKTLQEHVAHCMSVLADVAKQTGLALVVLAQLTRGHVKEGRPPEMDDLRGGGEIEEHAFHVVILHPVGKAEDTAAGRAWRGSTLALVEKNRAGPMGMVPLKFIGAQYRFRAWNHATDGTLDDVFKTKPRGVPEQRAKKPKPEQRTMPHASAPAED